MALNSSTVVLPRVRIYDVVQDGCQRLLTRNVINLCVKFSKLKNFKAPKAETGCTDACNRPPQFGSFPASPPRPWHPQWNEQIDELATQDKVRSPMWTHDPLLAADKPPCALTDWLQGVLEDNPDVLILQVRLHADDVDDLIQAYTRPVNPTVNNTQRRHVGTQGSTLLFAAHKPTTTKAGKDKYPFKHPHLDTLRYVVDSKPAMALPNYPLTSHSPYHLAAHWEKRTGEVGGHLLGSDRGTLRVGLDGARVHGGVPGEGWRHAGEHEDQGGQRGSELGRHLQRGMAKPKPAT